jgi:hypothetical protein
VIDGPGAVAAAVDSSILPDPVTAIGAAGSRAFYLTRNRAVDELTAVVPWGVW